MIFSVAHGWGSLLGAYAYLVVGVVFALAKGELVLLDALGTAFTSLFWAFPFAVVMFFVALPAGVLGTWLTRKAGYTTKADYILLGLTAGLMMAWYLEGILVEIYLESRDYQEIVGWERMFMYLAHYLRGAAAGALYGLSYWYHVIPTVTPLPEPSPHPQLPPTRKPRAAKGRNRHQ